MSDFLNQRFWKYRGKRIRPYMRNNVKLAGAIIFVPVFLLSMFIFWREHLIHVDISRVIKHFEWNVPLIIKSVLCSVLFAVGSIAASYILFFDSYKKILHRQKIAKMIFSNKFYEKENVKVRKLFSNDTDSKQKITYFPRMYYRVKNNHIYIRIAMDMSRFQNRFLDLGKDLENGLFCDLVDKQMEEGFVCFKLLYDVKKNRISIDDAVAENGVLPLMKHISWQFDKLPHMLIAGGTGGGKTYFMLTIIKACVGLGADVRILDPKNADLADLEEVLPKKVYSQKNGILMCLRKSVDGMMDRMDEMKQMPNYKTGENYAYLGLKPVFIFFDEYVAFMDLLDMKERNEALSYMKQLVMLGRQAGYFLVLGAQRPDAKYFADGIRDQFSFRVSLGLMSDTGYGMMFGDVDKAYVNKKETGRGYANVGTGSVLEFYSPIVPKGYEFMSSIKDALVGVEGAQATAVASGSESDQTASGEGVSEANG
ncbi:coupling conjugation protein ConQ [Bacillus inaquosorum]|uniref:coupling conjugation protein ConQ n=1 Tax=Bacillus inaquosorum TaxID=483913 RepID=UPI00228022C3|nr:coupling conjugation protein ConQ [Bacillus inaquosorum]MCY7901568.1 coupling conjugation protein ConQ [Bacillus inaquosorum]MCY7922848.1 coupling conjugation protein ConQ [Bacillus spizizenii]MCY9406552.1 coupling conjugation protein ConQ [Bacillus inaquosorum]MCY9416762.1 coupling conjugation protein ConQ [Bacillus inaquosorum]